MKKIIIIVVAIIAAAAWFASAQDFGSYDALKNPRFTRLPDQKMLVVESKGDPAASSQNAFGLLFKTFFSLKGVQMAAPRARWSGLENGPAPKEQWTGYFALPLPDSITALPAGSEGAKIETWTYGEVAEILHVGTYASETPTIERLHKFIKDGGYEIAGMHEEEYVRGPGMEPDPSKYLTVIRYQVKKK